MMGPSLRPKSGLRPWHWLALAGIAMITMCIVGVAVAGRPLPADPKIPPYEAGTSTGNARSGSQEPAPVAPVAVAPIVVKGKGNAAVQVGGKLNGAFTVDYSFGWFCGIGHFLKADGSNGAQFMEDINECAADTNSKASGSTVVHLTNVSLVRVENTQGAWSLTFKPLG